jgi:Cd2+/Zn2+-exporting ATPase
MRNKNHKRLITVAVSLACFAIAFVLDKAFPLPIYLPPVLYGSVWILAGWDVLLKAAKNIVRGKVFDEHFLMSAATVGAMAIGRYPEAAAVMIFYQAGEYVQSLAVSRSRASISSLLTIRPDKATVIRDGAEVSLAPEDVEIGEILVVRPGERVPLDGEILSGRSVLDTSALTGESVPQNCKAGDKDRKSVV